MLTRIAVLRFRSLRHVDETLERLQPVVGPIGSGKASFLDVPAFVADVLRDGPHAAMLGEGQTRRRVANPRDLFEDPAADSCEIVLEMEIPESLRPSLDGDYGTARYELEIAAPGNGDDVVIRHETLWLQPRIPPVMRLVQRQLFPDDVPPPPTLLASRTATPPRWRKVLNRSNDPARAWLFAETSNWNTSVPLRADRTVLAELPEDTAHLPMALAFRRLLRERTFRLPTSGWTLATPRLDRGGDPLAPDVFALVDAARKAGDRRLKDVRDSLASVLSWCTDLRVAEDADHRGRRLVLVTRDGKERPLDRESDSLARFVALVVAGLLGPQDAVLLADSPTMGFDEPAIAAALSALDRRGGPQTIFACCESPSRRPAETSYPIYLDRNDHGATRASRTRFPRAGFV